MDTNSTSRIIHVSKEYIKDAVLTVPHYQQASNNFIHAFMFDFGIEFVDFYRFEFSQEYGYLRLSEKARKTVRTRNNYDLLNI